MTEAGPSSRTRGFGPFVTLVTTEGPGGALERWESRRHRKHQEAATGSTWWAPASRGWWIGALFAVGSLLFALGALPPYAAGVGTRADDVTFFVGSLFFTSAGFLQYREVIDTGPGGPPRGWRKVATVEFGRIDWLATAVQLLGTLFFNVSTGYALGTALSAAQADHHVWRPDALGSVCFLVASALAWFEVCHGWTAWRPGELSWWITALNLVGSIAFGVSAVAAYIVPTTGQLVSVRLTNLGTFVGALCFLAGAVLLWPERTETSGAADPPRPAEPAPSMA